MLPGSHLDCKPLQGAYTNLGLGPGSFTVAEQLASEVFSLLMGTQTPTDAPERVHAALQRG